ncbi:MAG: hypothetical protein ACOC1X_00045 [Promethearchaeota archaeon]
MQEKTEIEMHRTSINIPKKLYKWLVVKKIDEGLSSVGEIVENLVREKMEDDEK